VRLNAGRVENCRPVRRIHDGIHATAVPEGMFKLLDFRLYARPTIGHPFFVAGELRSRITSIVPVWGGGESLCTKCSLQD